MKKKVFFMALAAIVAFASCDNDVENGSRYLSGYFTIAGDAKQGYTLYQDGGGIIKPSFQSIIAIAGKDGFADNERAFLNLSYKTDDIKPTDGGEMIAEANVMGGEYMPLHFPLHRKRLTTRRLPRAIAHSPSTASRRCGHTVVSSTHSSMPMYR